MEKYPPVRSTPGLLQIYLYGMKGIVIAFVFCSFSLKNHAQHCPWDCSGMIILQTPVSKEMVYKLKPVLVDDEKKVITDTMFGTGKATYDRCDFLSYEDFTKYRTKKITLHHWYQYDTFYHFAAGSYIVKYNFCEYQGKKLYLRFTDQYSQSKPYHYIEIPQAIRIHLHDYSNQLFDKKTEEIKNDVKTSVLILNCEEWGITKEDCKE